MATYQFYLAAIPKAGILQQLGHLPERLSTDDNCFSYWKAAAVPFAPVATAIDRLVDRASWGNETSSCNWKTAGEQPDNDAWMSTDPSTSVIKELHFRVDLRPEDQSFLTGMIAIAFQNNWLLMDEKGNLVPPEPDAIRQLIGTSNALCFLRDPEGFLRDIGEGRRQIE